MYVVGRFTIVLSHCEEVLNSCEFTRILGICMKFTIPWCIHKRLYVLGYSAS